MVVVVVEAVEEERVVALVQVLELAAVAVQLAVARARLGGSNPSLRLPWPQLRLLGQAGLPLGFPLAVKASKSTQCIAKQHL